MNTFFKLALALMVGCTIMTLCSPSLTMASPSSALKGTTYERVEVDRTYETSVSGVMEEDPSCGFIVSPPRGYSMCLVWNDEQVNWLLGLKGHQVTAQGPVYVLGLLTNDQAGELVDEFAGMEVLDIRPGRGTLNESGSLSGGGNFGAWLFPDSDRRYLNEGDLMGLSANDLWRARNEIFARRGYIFSSARGKALAASLGGAYHGTDSDSGRVQGRFNAYEKANVVLITRFEKGAPPANLSPWIFPDSDRRYLTRDELARLSPDGLWKARNEIFARRGYIFKTPRGRAYAKSLGSNYVAREPDIQKVNRSLNKFEKTNVNLIMEFE